MHDLTGDLRQKRRDGRFQRLRRRREVVFAGEIANDVPHAQLPHTAALCTLSLFMRRSRRCRLGLVVAAPDAEEAVLGVPQGEQGIADGGGDGERPQSGLAEAEVADSVTEQPSCHATTIFAWDGDRWWW